MENSKAPAETQTLTRETCRSLKISKKLEVNVFQHATEPCNDLFFTEAN